MATRSTVSILTLDGKLSSIYGHSDGNVSWNGAILFEHYRDVNKVKELISFGDMSSLAPLVSPPPGVPHSFEYKDRAEGVTTFYGRDRGETGVDARQYKDFEEYKKDGDFQEYDYVFKEKNNTWYLYSTETEKLQKLRSLLVKEQKNSPEIKEVLSRVALIELIQKEKKQLDENISNKKEKVNKIKV